MSEVKIDRRRAASFPQTMEQALRAALHLKGEQLVHWRPVEAALRAAAREQRAEHNDGFIQRVRNRVGSYASSAMALPDGQGELKVALAGYSAPIVVPSDPATGTLDGGEILLRKPPLASSR